MEEPPLKLPKGFVEYKGYYVKQSYLCELGLGEEEKKEEEEECNHEWIDNDFGKSSCVHCGDTREVKQEAAWSLYKPPILREFLRTYMKYGYKKFSWTYRLHRNASYDRVGYEIIHFIEILSKLGLEKEVENCAGSMFRLYFRDLKIRAKTRLGFLAHCIYSCSITMNYPVNLYELLNKLNIKSHSYNSAISTIKCGDYYPPNLHIYNKEQDDNQVIKLYNQIFTQDISYNKKTLLLGVLYYMSKDKQKFIQENRKIVSRNSMLSVNSYIINFFNNN